MHASTNVHGARSLVFRRRNTDDRRCNPTVDRLHNGNPPQSCLNRANVQRLLPEHRIKIAKTCVPPASAGLVDAREERAHEVPPHLCDQIRVEPLILGTRPTDAVESTPLLSRVGSAIP